MIRRYTGEPLPPNARVAVVANDAIGNFVVATPLLQMVRRELNPTVLHYYGGKRTLELQQASNLFDAHFPLHGSDLEAIIAQVPHPYDLILNVESGAHAASFVGRIAGEALVAGPVIVDGERIPFPNDPRGDLWRDQEWIAADITQRYPFLDSGFIAEIYARACYLPGPVPRYLLPSEAPPIDCTFDVLIATTASLPEKLWPLDRWLGVLKRLRDAGRDVGLLGAPPKAQSTHWQGSDAESVMVAEGLVTDFRGSFTLPQVVGAIRAARQVLTLDNGILHLAASTETPTVGLFRYGIHRLWCPPFGQIRPVVARDGGVVADIAVDDVWEALGRGE